MTLAQPVCPFINLTGVGAQWLYAGESSLEVSLTVNSSFIPISNL